MKSYPFHPLFGGLLLGLWLLAVPAWAIDTLEGRVTQVIDGDTLLLDSGESVRLLGIQAPELSHNGKPAEPYAQKARKRLTELALGQRVELNFDRHKRDRYGRLLAMVRLPDGRLAQERLLEEGMVYVYSFPDNRRLIPALYPFEEQARRQRLGGWKDRWRVVSAEAASESEGHFGWVEGTVRSASEVKNQIYLNFGSDWRKDFTLFISRKYRDSFADIWKGWQGKRLRVRGWVREHHGPSISLTHPEQVEILPANPHAE